MTRRKYIKLIFGMVLCLLVSMNQVSAQTSAGQVILVKGDATLLHAGNSKDLKRGMKIYSSDLITTGPHTRVVLKMRDDTRFTLSSNTDFLINKYQFSAERQEGSISVELFKGAMRTITGLIGKTPNKDLKVITRNASIGIRGTDFWVGWIFSKNLDVALFDGDSIYVENNAGRVVINQPGFGTTVKSPDIPPATPREWGPGKYNAALRSISTKGDINDDEPIDDEEEY